MGDRPPRSRVVVLCLACSLTACEALLGLDQFEAEPQAAAGAGGAAGGGGSAGLAGCGGGLNDCGRDGCVELDTDPWHCGQCERSCLGGPCLGGKCQPALLATDGVGEPVRLGLDPSHVYWSTSDGRLCQVSKTGGPVETLVEEPAGIGDIAVDATAVYWSTGSSIRRLSRGASAPVTLTAAANAYGMGQDTSYLYYSHHDQADSGGGIYRLDKFAAPSTPEIVHSLTQPAALLVDGNHIYVRVDRSPIDAIVRVANNGSDSDVWLDGHGAAIGAHDFVADPDMVYWLAADLLVRRPKGAGTVTIVLDGVELSALAGDRKTDGDLYVGDAWGRVRRTNKQDFHTKVLATDETPIRDLATDSDAVYWINAGGETKRLAK